MAIEPDMYKHMTRQERRDKRDAYVIDQGGRCWYCNGPLDSPSRREGMKVNWWRFPGGREGFLKHPVHLHHDHNTGLTVGAVHAYCNAVSFDYDEEPIG